MWNSLHYINQPPNMRFSKTLTCKGMFYKILTIPHLCSYWKYLGVWPLVGVVPPIHGQSGAMCWTLKKCGSVRKKYFLINERSFDILCVAAMYSRMCYFMYGTK